jgi:putative oxidoreductase
LNTPNEGFKPCLCMKKIIGLKPTSVIEIIAALFILLFLYTALNKSFQISSTTDVLKKTPILSGIAGSTAWSVVIAEYIIAALLFLPRTRRTGLYASLILMTGFTAYVGYMMVFVPDLPCSCGGVISKMTWGQHLIFNLVFVLLALTGILLQRNRLKEDPKDTETTPLVFT